MTKKQTILVLLLVLMGWTGLAKAPNDKLKEQLLRYDYSQLLMENDFLGYIGNGQRLYMHFDTIYKDPVKPQYYHVEGKSKVKQNLCSFTGGITIHSFAPNEESDSLVKRYHLKAQYQLNEDANQRGSGFFAGRLTSDFFIYRDSICFDEMEGGEDGYNNNQFEGRWTSYRTKISKKANFGIGRIPDSGNLDVGAAEFHVDPKKQHLGWESYTEAFETETPEGQKAQAEEDREWWKGDKEVFISWQSKTENEAVKLDIYRNKHYLQTLNLGENVLEYWVDQSDYNFDGHRDFAVWLDYAESKRVFLWSEKQGKYVHEPFFDNLESPTIFKDARCIVDTRYVNDKCIEHVMYQYDGQNYRLHSTLVQRGYYPEYDRLIFYDAAGNRVRELQNPTFKQFTPLWQKYAVLYYIDG
ncbi:XAC2610-related protein [Segatella maculosa]|uniref:XAC2610-related protein n=1 Tax=Segatella maculosa TaxID=439703 RepID=UPI0003706AC6|nr:hypothetical protein [Segatella maculosa]